MTKKFYKGKNDRVFKATFCNIQNTFLLKEFKLSEKDDLFVKKFKERIEELNDDDYFVSSISREEDLERIANTKQTLAFDEGLELGLEQGVIKTAKNLINLNLPLEKISEATGLSLEKLKKL